ncbi:MAG: PEP-CTERM sorting domain-containing protein [Pseudomonadota bacterium]
MKFQKTMLTALLATGAFAAPMAAQAVAVSSLTLSTVSFCMDAPGSSGTSCMATGTGGNVGTATVTGVDGTYNLVDGYHGAGTFSGGANAASIVDMMFFGGAVNVYTAASNLGATTTPAGSIAGGPVPTADVSGGAITMNLSSWFANYNGTDFNQGSPSIVGTWSSVDNSFSAIWSSTIVGGSFNNFIGTWKVTGTAVPVPEASTYGMMLAGLGLVGFAVRRRKLMA